LKRTAESGIGDVAERQGAIGAHLGAIWLERCPQRCFSSLMELGILP
jgi:hypothetical protein